MISPQKEKETITKRNKWTKEEYLGIIEAYYEAIKTKHPAGMLAGMYEIRRHKNPSIQVGIDVFKLNNQ